MAISGTEVEIIGPGLVSDLPEQGSYVQNMIFLDGSWQTRKGFGTVGEWDSTLSRYTQDPGPLSSVEGYKTHLGSHLMTTDFGHRQIISVFYMDAWNNQGAAGNTEVVSPFKGATRNPTYIVSIYDITARERWEEVIYKSTAERILGSPKLMGFTHGYYETNRYNDFANIIKATDNDQISFVESNDILFFGNGSTGFFYYKPAAYLGNTSKALETIPGFAGSKGYSESSIISRLLLAPGVHVAYSYIESIPNLLGITKLGNRIIYIARDRLYFSDDNYPASVIATHHLSVPTEKSITAVKEISGNLLIFTESETFLYQPTASFFVNTGTLTRLSETIGCLSLNSILNYENSVAWVDTNGVYVNSGGLNLSEISQNIKPFFKNIMPNPLSHFHASAGATDLDVGPQPPIQYNLDTTNITITYSNRIKALMVTVPEQRITLVYNEGSEWSVWVYDSAAKTSGGVNVVGLHSFMDCQQILADGNDIYCVGLDNREENKIKTDSASVYNRGTGNMEPTILRTQRFNTYFICEYDRGGGCDRNIDDEDYRYGIGEWVNTGITTYADPWSRPSPQDQSSTGVYFDFIIGKPQKIAPNFRIDGTTFTNGGVLVPLQIQVPPNYRTTDGSGYGNYAGQFPYIRYTTQPLRSELALPGLNSPVPVRLKLEFEFDKDHWAPVIDAGTAKVNVIFKTPLDNAQAGIGNYIIGAAMATDHQCQLHNPTTVAVDPTGNLLKFAYDGQLAATNAYTLDFSQLDRTFTARHFIVPPWSIPATGSPTDFQPLPVPADKIVTIGWIPFQRLLPAESVSSMAIQGVRGALSNDNGTDYWRSNNFVWNFSSLGTSDSAHREDNVTQGVDWAYMSAPVALDDGDQFKARGLYTQLKSYGMSEDPIDNGWAAAGSYRLYNSAVSADGTAWQGQVVDQQAVLGKPQAIAESDSLTTTPFPPVGVTQENSIRVKVLDTANVMKYKTFDNPANTWGVDGTATGTVLIDDPQFGEIAQSNSTRGSWFNWLLFGYVLDKAEAIFIKSGKAIIRKIAGRRRRGHSGGTD